MARWRDLFCVCFVFFFFFASFLGGLRGNFQVDTGQLMINKHFISEKIKSPIREIAFAYISSRIEREGCAGGTFGRVAVASVASSCGSWVCWRATDGGSGGGFNQLCVQPHQDSNRRVNATGDCVRPPFRSLRCDALIHSICNMIRWFYLIGVYYDAHYATRMSARWDCFAYARMGSMWIV